MINILLCCEGSADIKVMQVFIRSLSFATNICFVEKSRGDIKQVTLLGTKYSKHSTASRKLAQLAKTVNCRHIAYHQDEDNKGLNYIQEKVKSIFSLSSAKGMSCIAIVPQRMTESWLLSDVTAFEKTFGSKPNNPELPSKPEETWGNKGAEEHPKTIMANVLAQYRAEVSPEIFGVIAENTDIDVLTQRCPKSFGQFRTDMQTFITEGVAA